MSLLKNDLVNGILYGAAAVGTMIGETTGTHTLVLVCKPLLMLVLSSWFYFKSRRLGDRFTLLVQVGLLFSWFGDIALMFQQLDEFFFLVGLGAFLVAQLCYTIAFANNLLFGDARWSPMAWALVLGLLLYGTVFGLVLIPRVDQAVQMPVTVYAVAITCMGVAAALRHRRTYPRSFLLVLLGALLFITSDSLLAVNRFLYPLSHAPWSVMLTYAAAQYLIVSGCLAHVLAPDEIRRKAALNT